MALPPCGIYKTTRAIGPIPADRLVYFHNHGNPGPGIYPPSGWKQNRATFSDKGVTLPDLALAESLKPLLNEGLYRVGESFTCCEKNCRTYEPELLVQLGYDGEARPILFVPEWTDEGFVLPERGQRVDDLRLSRLEFLVVPERRASSTNHLH